MSNNVTYLQEIDVFVVELDWYIVVGGLIACGVCCLVYLVVCLREVFSFDGERAKAYKVAPVEL